MILLLQNISLLDTSPLYKVVLWRAVEKLMNVLKKYRAVPLLLKAANKVLPKTCVIQVQIVVLLFARALCVADLCSIYVAKEAPVFHISR